MKKKLLCWLITLCLLCSIISLPAFGAAKTLIRMDAKSKDTFELVKSDGDTTISNDGVICKSSAAARFFIVPKSPISINRMDTTIKYRFKVDTNKPIDYVAVRIYGKDVKASVANTVMSNPQNGVWYEGQFLLSDAKIASNSRQFQKGDVLKQFMLDAKNSNEADLKVTWDYVEFFEPDGAEVIKPVDESSLYLAKINKEIADAKPGDIIEINDGTYTNCLLTIPSSGTKEKPIIVKAKNAGKAIFTGSSTMTISGKFINVDGLCFKDGKADNVIKFDSSSEYCSINNCAIINYNGDNPDTSSRWVYIEGSHNTVDSCYFRDKKTPGQMLEVIRKSTDANYHTVSNNYFGYFKSGLANGFETVRVGTSTNSLSSSKTTFVGNFFERCDGEAEIISNKSCENTFTNNTFYDSKGALTLRHGNDCTVNGNLFIGGSDTTRVTGVRVIGSSNKVFDNYFFNLPITSTSVTIEEGVPNGNVASYGPVDKLDFHNNTFIGGDREIWLGAYYAPSTDANVNRVIAPEGKVYDNAIITYKGKQPIIENSDVKNKIEFSNNLIYGKDLGYDGGTPSGIKIEDPAFTLADNGLYKVDGNIGANIDNLKNAPKSPADVISDWIKKDFYDTNVYKFEQVSVDPINGSKDSVNKIFPTKDQINIIINGSFISFDVPPQTINERTMVPMRAIFETLGAKVDWDESTSTATAVRDKTTIKITENSEKAFVNDKEDKLDSPAVIIDDRFLVPVRFISESFGATVDWNEEFQIVSIDLAKVEEPKDPSIVYPPMNSVPNSLTVYAIEQSGDDGAGNSIECTLDGRLTTRWASQEKDGNKAYGIFDLGESKSLDKIGLAFYSGDKRIYNFSIAVSEDGKTFTNVIENAKSSGGSTEIEYFNFSSAKGRYVKFIGEGNNTNKWNNITEIVFVEKK